MQSIPRIKKDPELKVEKERAGGVGMDEEEGKKGGEEGKDC